MEKYNYYEAVKEDVKQWIDDHEEFTLSHVGENGVWVDDENKWDVIDELVDTLWAEDSVTGNASGSYTFSTWEAEENLCHNLDLLSDALDDFGGNVDVLKKGAEWCDVTIRCYLLPQVVDEVITEIIEG